MAGHGNKNLCETLNHLLGVIHDAAADIEIRDRNGRQEFANDDLVALKSQPRRNDGNKAKSAIVRDFPECLPTHIAKSDPSGQ